MVTPDLPKKAKERSLKRYGVLGVKHFAAIGRAVDRWNSLEFLIDRLIWKLAHKEQSVAACLTAQYSSVHQRMSALISLITLYHLLSDKPLADLKKLRGNLGSLGESRNRLVHDPRFRRDDGFIVRYEVIAKAGLIFGSKEETLAELDSFCDDVNASQIKLLEIMRVLT